MYTRHGHHIPGTTKDDPPDMVARCGGPGVCVDCSTDWADNMNADNEEIEIVHEPQKIQLLETKIYTRKPFEVTAVQVTGGNMAAIAEWTDGHILEKEGRPYVKVSVTRPLNERQTRAYVGDWVLKAGTGFKVYTNQAFHKTFEEAGLVAYINREDAELEQEALKRAAADDVLDGGVVGE